MHVKLLSIKLNFKVSSCIFDVADSRKRPHTLRRTCFSINPQDAFVGLVHIFSSQQKVAWPSMLV
jgi:hypothetical protein